MGGAERGCRTASEEEDPVRGRLPDVREDRFWTRVSSYRPSASMIVALVALFVAMGGTGYAVKRLPKRSVGPAQLKKDAVRTKNIKARNVTRSRIAKRSINADLVGTDALVGKNILESSLGQVPEATHAAGADSVGGLSLKRFSFRAPAGTGGTSVLSLGGLTISAACSAGTSLSASATTSVGGAVVHSGGTWSTPTSQSFYAEDNSFAPGDNFGFLDEGTTNSTSLNGTLVYARADGVIVTVDFLAEESAGTCILAGTATG
jgi:hypothetical protein